MQLKNLIKLDFTRARARGGVNCDDMVGMDVGRNRSAVHFLAVGGIAVFSCFGGSSIQSGKRA